MLRRLYALAALTLLLNACGGGSGGSSDTPPPPPPPPANTTSIDVQLDTLQVVGGSSATGSASADLLLNNDDGSLTGTVTVTGITADSVSLRNGFAGESGAEIILLNNSGSGNWSVPPNTVLGQTERDALDSGGLHLLVTTVAAPDGALRGQILLGDLRVLRVTLSPLQSVPLLESTASGLGFITLDDSNGALVAHVNTTGVDDATVAHIHQALAGQNGPVLIGLTKDPSDDGHWFSEDATLSSDGMTALASAGLYFNVHTPAHPSGEIRGQIAPADVEIIFTSLTGTEIVPTEVSTTARAMAAITLPAMADANTDPFVLSAFINTEGLDDATSATLNIGNRGQNGAVIADLEQDTGNATRWANASIMLDAAQRSALFQQGLYFTIATPMFPDGEVRGQVIPAESMEPSNATFTFIQDNVFTPICSECHGGGSPSAGLNLSAGQAYNNIVGVNSNEVPSLKRIEAGNPNNSYLVQKIEGTAAVGGRMPLGGAALDSMLIQTIRQWVSEGAQNN